LGLGDVLDSDHVLLRLDLLVLQGLLQRFLAQSGEDVVGVSQALRFRSSLCFVGFIEALQWCSIMGGRCNTLAWSGGAQLLLVLYRLGDQVHLFSLWRRLLLLFRPFMLLLALAPLHCLIQGLLPAA
jgi:hypothetical protein